MLKQIPPHEWDGSIAQILIVIQMTIVSIPVAWLFYLNVEFARRHLSVQTINKKSKLLKAQSNKPQGKVKTNFQQKQQTKLL